MKALLILSLMVWGFAGASGAIRVWTGAQSGAWSNPNNWENGETPQRFDSIVFPANAINRQMTNDFVERELGNLTFTGGGYNLRGNRFHVYQGIASIPSSTTNRIECEVFVQAPQSFSCFGYFNQLEFGRIELFHPLRLEPSSCIMIYGVLAANNGARVIKASTGKLAFGAFGRVEGALLVEEGEVELPADSTEHFDGVLTVGEDDGAPVTVQPHVTWRSTHRVSDGSTIEVKGSGRLELNGFSERVGTLSGGGVVDLGGGYSGSAWPMFIPCFPASFKVREAFVSKGRIPGSNSPATAVCRASSKLPPENCSSLEA